jgi:hypothetical protein
MSAQLVKASATEFCRRKKQFWMHENDAKPLVN